MLILTETSVFGQQAVPDSTTRKEAFQAAPDSTVQKDALQVVADLPILKGTHQGESDSTILKGVNPVLATEILGFTGIRISPTDTTLSEEECAIREWCAGFSWSLGGNPPAAPVSTITAAPAAHDTTIISSPASIFRLKTNLLYDVVTVANLSFEAGFCKHWAVEFLGTFSPWDITNTFKFRTLLLQPEVRYYLNEQFTGHYFGVEGHCAWYNIALPNDHTRYQDLNGNTPLWGAGITYGYILPFGKHWGMDFCIGLGYANLKYDCFYNIENGDKYTTGSKNWVGPTKIGATIYYQF